MSRGYSCRSGYGGVLVVVLTLALLSLGEANLFGNSDPTHYDVLGVHPKATTAEIRKAFRDLSLKFHPDKLLSLPEEEQEMLRRKYVRILEAFETLKDEEKRSWYDAVQSRYQFFYWSTGRGWQSTQGPGNTHKGAPGHTTVEIPPMMQWLIKTGLALFLSILLTLSFYLHVVIVHHVYNMLYRNRYLWKVVAVLMFALMWNILHASSEEE
ncbi:Chaperone protein dnaJ GFA2, mitochondrial [Balamuthia mandrillaris]